MCIYICVHVEVNLQVLITWASVVLLQEPLLREAGVPIPDGFAGAKKSFTLPAGDDGRLAIGVLSPG